MAKVTGPAHSVRASGTLAGLITFDKRGIAHKPNAPGEQLTAGRGNARQIFLSMSRALQLCQASVKTAIKAAAHPDRDWRAWLMRRAIGQQRSAWDSTGLVWANFTDPQRATWDDAATATGFTATAIAYATDDPISAGLAMLALASALYAAGIVTDPGEPAADNASEWAVSITGEGEGDPIGDALRADAVAYWKLDEASGTRADATGNGNNLTDARSNVASESGKVGQSASFVMDENSVLYCLNNSDLRITGGSFTVCAWLWLDAKAPCGYTIIGKTDNNDTEWAIDYRPPDPDPENNPDRFDWYMLGAGYEFPGVIANTFGAPNLHTWYFVVIAYDATNGVMKIRVDNGADDTFDWMGGTPETTAAFGIGGYVNEDPPDPPMAAGDFDGRVDEVGIWKRLLTEEELAYLWNSGAGRALFP